MKVRIASVGDLSPTQSGDSYIANLIVLIEGQAELMSLKVIVPNDKVSKISEGAVLDVIPTPKAIFSVRKYEASNGKAEEIASKIDQILKGAGK